MKNFIHKLPVPMAGLMLALAALGNLLQSYSESIRPLFGVLSAVLALLLTTKVVLYFGDVRKDLQNPVMASVAPTFSMGLILLAGYLVKMSVPVAFALWIAAIVLHWLFILYFTVKFLFHFDFQKVFASYFIVYVGIVTVSVTAPAFGQTGLGRAMFWFGFAAYLPLLLLVLYRLLTIKNFANPVKPTNAIFAAPAALCLAGYLASFEQKSTAMIVFLLILSQLLYLAVLCGLPAMMKAGFFPSYSGLTFPLVITAISLKQASGFFAKAGTPVGFLNVLVPVETGIAGIAVLYVLICYLSFLFRKTPAQKQP